MAHPSPASRAACPFPHTGLGRLRTGHGKDTPAIGDEDSGAHSGTHPALAQCQVLSMECAGPRSPRRLYLSIQVESLKEKLISQAQEVSRLQSELGGTDLEKQWDLLIVENEQLRQEMQHAKLAAPCMGCKHSQASAQPRDRLAQLQLEVAENKSLLSELNLEVQQKTYQLDEVELWLKDCLAKKAQEEEWLSRLLSDSHETIASVGAQSSPIKYVIKMVEVESSKTKQALNESQTRNQHLQEQVAMQRQELKEMEQQLQSSHQLTAQLRAQIAMSEAELHRRCSPRRRQEPGIEEAFARAQMEMKVVHENLAGIGTKLLTCSQRCGPSPTATTGSSSRCAASPCCCRRPSKGVKVEISIKEVSSNS